MRKLHIMKFLIILFGITLITGCATGALGGSNAKFHVRGQMIDQYGHSVSDVKVTYQYAYNDSVLLVLPTFYPTVKTGHFITDKDGRFDLGMFSVQSIMLVSVIKPGYYYANQKAEYSVNDKKNVKPLKIRLWKIGQQADTLVKKRIRMLNIDADGSEYILDLHHGVFGKNINSGTDMKVSIKQMKQIKDLDDGDWSVNISVPGGGLIESNDLYMFEAPENGYQPIWHMISIYGKPGSSFDITKKFYFKLKSGAAYGRMEVRVIAYYYVAKRSVVSVTYTMNPNGSRNLYQK